MAREYVIRFVTTKPIAIVCFALFCMGCGMSDDQLRQKTGDAAVSVKRAAQTASDSLKGAYDDAAQKGREAMKGAGEKLSDAALRAKVLAGFSLLADLNAKDVKVEARGGKVYLSGTVPTQIDKMKVEGVAYGVTGDPSKYESTVQVQ